MAKRRSIADRIRELMAEQKPPLDGPTELGRFLDVSKQTAGSWLNEDREPGACNVYLIADRFKVSARWVFIEEGPKERHGPVTADAAALLHYYSNLADEGEKQALLTLAKSLYSQQDKRSSGEV